VAAPQQKIKNKKSTYFVGEVGVLVLIECMCIYGYVLKAVI
jgi:hypothetical protein